MFLSVFIQCHFSGVSKLYQRRNSVNSITSEDAKKYLLFLQSSLKASLRYMQKFIVAQLTLCLSICYPSAKKLKSSQKLQNKIIERERDQNKRRKKSEPMGHASN